MDERQFSFNIPVVWQGLNYNIDYIENYFNTLFDGDKEKIEELQKVLGSIIVQKPIYKTVFMVGKGGNGKTTFMNLLEKLLGRYICKTFGLSVQDNYNKTMAESMILSMAEGAENYLTDQDYVFLTSRFLSNEQFEGPINHALFFECNQMPTLKNYWLDQSIVFEFTHYFSANTTVLSELEGHLDELLVWLVKGCSDCFK